MKALIVFCHPKPGSFNHAVLQAVTRELQAAGAEYRVADLYKDGFVPAMTRQEWECYEDTPETTCTTGEHVDNVRWCDTLIFIYPTWWFGPPAMLKGWLDRVLVPGVAFSMPTADNPTFGKNLTHISRIGLFTTCGASWLLTRYVGAPGKRTIMRGLKPLCHPKAKTAFAAHYRMDFSTPQSRARHLARVQAKMRRLIGRPARQRQSITQEQTA